MFSVLEAAFIFTLQRVRKFLFFSFRPRKERDSAWRSASLAARSFDFLPQRKPLVRFKSFSLFLWAIVPLLTLGILVVDKFFHRVIQ